MADIEKTLLLRIIGDASAAVKAATDAGGALGKISTIAGGFVLGKAFTELPGFLMDAAQAAADDAASVARLKQAVDNTGESYESHRAKIEEVIAAGQGLAFTDDQVRDGLSLLTAQTGNADEAQGRLKLAMDLSRGANIDLQTASKLLGKVTDENVNVLGRYGISVAKGTSETELFGMIQQKFGGQSEAFAKSAAGQMEMAKDKISELKEQLGYALLPALGAVANFLNGTVLPAVAKLGEFITSNREVMIILGTTVAALVIPPLVGMAAATIAATWPLVAIGVAIGGVVAAVLWLHDNWQKVWGAMPTGVQNALSAVTSFVQGLVGMIKGALDWIIDQINKIKFQVPDWVPGIGGKQVGVELPHIDAILGAIGGAIGGVVDSVKGAIAGAQPAIGQFNATVGNTGDTAGKADDKLKSMTDTLQKQLIEAWQKGGDEQVATVRAQQATMMANVQDAARRMAKSLGLDMPTAVLAAFDKINGDAIKMADTLAKIDDDNLKSREAAWLAGGAAQEDKQIAINATMFADAEALATKLHDRYGVSLPDALVQAMDHVQASAKAMSDAAQKAKQDTFDLTKQLWALYPNASAAGAANLAAVAAAAGSGAPQPTAQQSKDNAATLAAAKALGLATGGIVQARPGGTLVNVGEGGRNEAVIPFGPGGVPSFGGVTVIVNNYGTTIGTSQDFKDSVAEAIVDARNRGAAI